MYTLEDCRLSTHTSNVISIDLEIINTPFIPPSRRKTENYTCHGLSHNDKVAHTYIQGFPNATKGISFLDSDTSEI